MVPTAILVLIAGGLIVGSFLKLFSDHRDFRRQLRDMNQELDTVLDVLSTVALSPGDSVRIEGVQRRLHKPESPEEP